MNPYQAAIYFLLECIANKHPDAIAARAARGHLEAIEAYDAELIAPLVKSGSSEGGTHTADPASAD